TGAGALYYADCEEFITLRAEPDVGSEALTTIPRGAQMSYVSAAGEFACVDYQGRRGYVLASYIAPVPSEPEPEPAETESSLIDKAKEWLDRLS
ncbi:MAG TPA: SH3 domain-containing protein, partial [Candidatus Scatomorpha merdipullorum]|nr:SH3 domain-containing protein [Candidatus Scatomorpha merdipullorum]